MQKLLPLVFLLSVYVVGAQSIPASGASQLAGGSGVAVSGINSLFENQAGMAEMNGFGVISSVSQPFTLSELNTVAMGVAIPFSSGVFGFRIHSFGFEEYRQNGAGLAFARKLGERLSLGAQFDYWSLRIPEYGSDGILSFEIGAQAKLTENLTLGTHISNPIKIAWSDGSAVPAVFRVGAEWRLSVKTVLSAELEKNVDYPIRIKSGVGYRLSGPLIIRMGVGTRPATFAVGIGLALNAGIDLDAGTVFHQTLGSTPVFGASYVKKTALH